MTERKQFHCNVCGKELKMDHEVIQEEVFSVTKEWGYFSGKDLEIHSFVMCEDCYDQMISDFKIPVMISQKKEVL